MWEKLGISLYTALREKLGTSLYTTRRVQNVQLKPQH